MLATTSHISGVFATGVARCHAGRPAPRSGPARRPAGPGPVPMPPRGAAALLPPPRAVFEPAPNGSAPSPPACVSVSEALRVLGAGQPVAILDAADREGETDLFFPAISLTPSGLRLQRTAAGGELYIAVGADVAAAFGFPFAGDALAAASGAYPVLQGMAKYSGDMCQGTCSVGLSLDHRSTHTGAPDNERSFTCRRLAEMAEEALARSPSDVAANAAGFGAEFHVPGHVFMCTEREGGLAARQGHTELAVALGRAAGVVPVMVGCVMLSNEGENFGALPPAEAAAWCAANDVPFLDGKQIMKELLP
eukprot:jgi/Tetstr1/425925/TSEL_001599.t1